MVKIKRSRYLHDLIEAVLVYEAREVRKRLKTKYSHPLLRQYRLDNARQEVILFRENPEDYPYPFVFADVVWFVHKNGGGRGSVVHEVKTGRFSLPGALAKYARAGAMINNYPVAPLKQGNTLFCLWSWRENIKEELHAMRESELNSLKLGFSLEDTEMYIRRKFMKEALKAGLFRICYLEWIEDLILDAVKEINEVVNYGDPRHRHSPLVD